MNKTTILLILTFSSFIFSASAASGLPGRFSGKTLNPCEVSFARLLNGKIPAEAKGNAALNMWDERFSPETILKDIQNLPNKEARFAFVEDLQKLIYKDQDFVDNLADTINLMMEKRLLNYQDVKKLFLDRNLINATFFYSHQARRLTGKISVDLGKKTIIDETIGKFRLTKSYKKEYSDILLQSRLTKENLELANRSGLKLRNDAKALDQFRHYIEFLDSVQQPKIKSAMKNIEKIYDYGYRHRSSVLDSVLPIHKKFLAQKSRTRAFEARRVGEIEQGFKLQMNKKYTEQLDDLIAKQKQGINVDPAEIAILKRKIEDIKLPKRLKKRALSQAKGEKNIFRKLMNGCSKGNSKRLASARKKFMRFKLAVGIAGTPVFYYLKNKDKMDTDQYWFEKLGYEWAASIIFSYAGGKLITGQNSGFWKKYLKGYFVFRGMDAINAYSYNSLFGTDENIRKIQQLYTNNEKTQTELEEEFNRLIQSPTYRKDIRELLAYLETQSQQKNTRSYLNKLFNFSAYESYKSEQLTEEDLESAEGQEMLMELLAERMYLQNMGDWPIFQTGSKGGDRWSFYAARASFWDIKGLAFNLMLFQIMCKEPLGKAGSWALVVGLYLADTMWTGDWTYGLRREAINQ